MEHGNLPHLKYSTPFSAYLDEGEKMLWVGRPRQGVFLRPADALQIPFTLAWLGFAIFWEWSVIRGFSLAKPGARPVMALFGLPFLAAGIYGAAGRFFVEAWRRRRIWYGITDSRAMIVSIGSRRDDSVVSFDLDAIGVVEMRPHADGTATLIFGSFAPPRRSGPKSTEAPSNIFDHALDGAEAYALIRRIQRRRHLARS